AVDETLDAEDLPFIEVGAPGKKVDGSPSVMASSPAAAKPLTPPPPPSETPKHTPTVVPTLAEPAPLSVSFESWPAKGAAARVAREIIAHHQPHHPISKQYGELFAKMTECLGHESGLIACAGAAPQAGATTVLLNVAFSG